MAVVGSAIGSVEQAGNTVPFNCLPQAVRRRRGLSPTERVLPRCRRRPVLHRGPRSRTQWSVGNRDDREEQCEVEGAPDADREPWLASPEGSAGPWPEAGPRVGWPPFVVRDVNIDQTNWADGATHGGENEHADLEEDHRGFPTPAGRRAEHGRGGMPLPGGYEPVRFRPTGPAAARPAAGRHTPAMSIM